MFCINCQRNVESCLSLQGGFHWSDTVLWWLSIAVELNILPTPLFAISFSECWEFYNHFIYPESLKWYSVIFIGLSPLTAGHFPLFEYLVWWTQVLLLLTGAQSMTWCGEGSPFGGTLPSCSAACLTSLLCVSGRLKRTQIGVRAAGCCCSSPVLRTRALCPAPCSGQPPAPVLRPPGVAVPAEGAPGAAARAQRRDAAAGCVGLEWITDRINNSLRWGRSLLNSLRAPRADLNKPGFSF